MPGVLWWGRFDPGYSRNRILRELFVDLGWRVDDFRPRFSPLGDLQARLQGIARPDLVWVPCFRQRDLAAAARWARARRVPLVFDPLISAYDKQVDERQKLDAGSARARRLLDWERGLFARADRVLADTPAHADYFEQQLGVTRERLAVVYVGAQAALFHASDLPAKMPGEPIEVLFYGSFIHLQGPEVIVEAARRTTGLPVNWTLLGAGPMKAACERAARGLDNVRFEDWLPYEQIPARIHRADILLGVFGDTPKAGRVIPNKVYQALACGRPLVTRAAPAYPRALAGSNESGIAWVPAGDAGALATCIGELAAHPQRLPQMAAQAAATSRAWFSRAVLREQLRGLLDGTNGFGGPA